MSSIHPDFRIIFQNQIFDVRSYLQTDVKMNFENPIRSFLKEWMGTSDTVSVQTSGSTGTPKTILLQKAYMKASARATLSFFDLSPKNSALLCLSADFIAGKMMLVRAMVGGLHLVIEAVSGNPLEQLTQNVDFAPIVPLQLYNGVPHLSKVSTILIGGGVLNTGFLSTLEDCGSKIYQSFGMTETISHVALRPIFPIFSNQYQGLPGVSFSTDQDSCLIIHFAAIGIDNLHTHDVVDLKSPTSFVWKGRSDFIINTGGIKVNPETVEELLASQIEQRFFVTGLPDEKLGEKLVLIVEGNESTSLDFGVLLKYHLPKAVYYVPKFKETPTGKIQRQETVGLIEDFRIS